MTKRAKATNRLRSPDSYSRSAGQRRPRQCVLIVCEGVKTEPLYFEALRVQLGLTMVEVEIEGEGEVSITVVEHALANREQRKREVKKAKPMELWAKPPFDEVWCVFDVEGVTENKQSLHRAVDKAKANNLNLAVSNPAFEYWYLLHFKSTTQPFADASEVKTALRKVMPDYEKNQNILPKIYDRTNEAISRAKEVARHAPPNDPFPNPSTSVFKLVESLQAMSSRARV